MENFGRFIGIRVCQMEKGFDRRSLPSSHRREGHDSMGRIQGVREIRTLKLQLDEDSRCFVPTFSKNNACCYAQPVFGGLVLCLSLVLSKLGST